MMLLLFVTLRDAPLFFAQANPSTSRPTSGTQSLEMTTIGNGHLFGHRAAFRTYETPDHTEALVWYGKFQSEQEAVHAIEESLKDHKVNGEEHIKDPNGRVVGDRIVATPEARKESVHGHQEARSQLLDHSINLAGSCDAGGRVDRTATVSTGACKGQEEPIVMRQIRRISVEAAAVVQGGGEEPPNSPRDGGDQDQRRW